MAATTLCDYVIESGPEDSKNCCGAHAKWRTEGNHALCDDHKGDVEEKSPGREITLLEEDENA